MVTLICHRFPPLRPLSGPLELNGKLNNAEKLFENDIKGPEGLVVFNNELYMSLHGGYIMKLVNDKLVPVLKTGKDCEMFWEERLCGRPLGLAFDQGGSLYCADAYYGIIKLNLTSGEKITLVKMDIPIDGKNPMIPNSVAVSKDGNVFWTDSSTTHYLYDGVYVLLSSGTGRLLVYNPKKNTSKVLLEKLYFPNGVALSADESFVLVAETGKARILRYYIKGDKQGRSDIFIDSLPGLPDNIHSDGSTGFLVALISPQEQDSPFITSLRYPSLREFIVRIFHLLDLSFKQINKYFPTYYTKRAEHWIGHFESLKWLYGDRVTIVSLDNEGRITGSLHATDGKISSISDIINLNGYYYLGSPYNTYLARVKY
ncbi:hypothetical protein AAG570_013041 [Ranatra chinensis]|uniref:Strictosidine synthase conserved region domain-containing protein n=1 Tax=Ranatra chinensis TaxID=642074 RepID=A0ABD0YU78_9HEMI